MSGASGAVMAPPSERRPLWSTHVDWFDLLVLGFTIILAGVTIWTTSAVVRDAWDSIVLLVTWPIAGVLWASMVALRMTDRVARLLIVATLVVGAVAVFTMIPVVLFWVVGPPLVVVGALLGAAVFGIAFLRERPLRLVWLAAPLVVVVTAVVVASGVPSAIRFAVAEPALTAFVEGSATGGTTSPAMDGSIDVGGIPVYEVYRSAGQVLLVTAYVGILGDDGAGLAFVPEGTPTEVGEWEHLSGPWFRWYPY